MNTCLTPTRGVSLVEALIALAVMAFGMLGVTGLQTSLRTNADAARQRSEAVRIGEEHLEKWRRFSVLTVTAGHAHTYAGITGTPATAVAGYTTNTTYSVGGNVVESIPPGHKSLVVDVGWTDRLGQAQNVRLYSLVAQLAPELSASVVAPAGGAPTRNPLGRHRAIPFQARDFGDGTSGFIPPQASGGTVGWLFNNAEGWFRVCTTTVTSTAALTTPADLVCVVELEGTVEVRYLALSGFVSYDTGSSAPTAASVLAPTGPTYPDFDINATQTAPTARSTACFRSPLAGAYREYFCAMRVTVAARNWTGSVAFAGTAPLVIAPTVADGDPTMFKICRFRAAAEYTIISGSLANENYVVIRAGTAPDPLLPPTPFSCPTPPTWPHQPSA